MESVVITGSAGLIGSHLARKYLDLGWKVVGIDNLIGGYKENMPLNEENFTYHHIDILDIHNLIKTLTFHEPSLVIHCAALAHEGLSVFAPKTIVENIYSGTASLCSAAIQAGVKTFINTTSMARYGEINPPFTEDQEVLPVDPYGLAKVHAEQHLNLMSDIHGIKVLHVVPHNVCGPHQCYSDPFRNVMSIFGNLIMRDRPVYIYGDGSQKRSFSHVKDCVDAFITLYNKKDELDSGEVFNIGPDHGSETTVLELAQRVGAHCNKEPEINFVPERPREVKNAWVSTDKAAKVLGYSADTPMEDTIRDTITWIRTQPKRDFNYHLDLEIVNETTPKTWTNQLFNK
jgi:UDP-glucose 4-epimerase